MGKALSLTGHHADGRPYLDVRQFLKIARMRSDEPDIAHHNVAADALVRQLAIDKETHGECLRFGAGLHWGHGHTPFLGGAGIAAVARRDFINVRRTGLDGNPFLDAREFELNDRLALGLNPIVVQDRAPKVIGWSA